MTWYADEIILRATPGARETVMATPQFAPFSYHIRSVKGHAWYKREQEHGVTDDGLLVVRPVCGNSSHGFEWHGIPVLDWTTLEFEPRAESLLDQCVAKELSEYLDEESLPPSSLRKAVAGLSLRTGEPVIYFGCGMWGGDIVYEYCLVYEPKESLVMTKPTPPPDPPGTEDALRAGLLKLGLRLPTPYFAPHTRDFPWRTHKLR